MVFDSPPAGDVALCELFCFSELVHMSRHWLFQYPICIIPFVCFLYISVGSKPEDFK